MTNAPHHQTTCADAITVTTAPANLALVKLSRAILDLTAETATDETFLAAMDIEAALVRVTKEYRARLKDAAIDYLERAGGVDTATTRFYVGDKKTTKCRDTRAAVDAILQAAGGDFDEFMACLSSQPLKHGQCRAVLGDDWGQHFTTETAPDLKTGKPAREIKRALPK